MAKRKPGSTNTHGKSDALTPQVMERVIAALRAGNHRDVAAHYAGITPPTLADWLRRGDPSHPRCEPKFVEFRAKCVESETTAEVNAVSTILRSGRDNPKFLQWYLERKYPARWGRRTRFELTTPDDDVDDDVDLSGLSTADLKSLHAILGRTVKS